MLMPARTATSSRRSPGTRRGPYAANPAWSGVIRPRREVRNSRISCLVSTKASVRPGDVDVGVTASSSLNGGSHLVQIRALLGAMTAQNKTWLITGAGRGMGVDFAKAALAGGHNVVATGRNPDTVAKAVGESDDLLVVKLDVTSTQDAEAAVKAAVDRFGGIDVLVNNAASFEAGFFEELSPEQIERQFAVSVFGLMHVTRAVLPVMRRQGSGHVVAI